MKITPAIAAIVAVMGYLVFGSMKAKKEESAPLLTDKEKEKEE
jgi:hypothetical protein